MAWMGAWIQANQASKSGAASPVALVVGTLVIAAIVMAVATVLGFPGAGFGLGTFGVAVLPALAIFTALSLIGVRRR
jgi:hypothetical protein